MGIVSDINDLDVDPDSQIKCDANLSFPPSLVSRCTMDMDTKLDTSLMFSRAFSDISHDSISFPWGQLGEKCVS